MGLALSAQVLAPSRATAAPPDGGIAGAGPNRPDAGSAPNGDATTQTSNAARGDGAVAPPDAAPASQPLVPPADWKGDQIKAIRAGIEALEAQTKRLLDLKRDSLDVPPELATLFRVDLTNPSAASRRAAEVANRRLVTEAQIEERAARLKLMTPLLERPINRAARLVRRRRRVPKNLQEQAAEADKRLQLLRLEHQILATRMRWLTAMEVYLVGSQPHRIAAERERSRNLAERAAKERAEAERAQRSAAKTEHDAERAQKQALLEKARARSEIARMTAGERARLEGVRGAQAKLEQRLAHQLDALAKLRNELETFRGKIAARSDALKASWPQTATRFDTLYDEVVAKLVELRPRALEDLWTSLRGVPETPRPKDPSPRIRRLAENHTPLRELTEFSGRLEEHAERLHEAHAALVLKRLALLQNEVSWLNEHRTGILGFTSPKKRSQLAGVSKETLAQLAREVSQLGFDAVYWAFRRLRQIDQIPKLIIDFLTVGSLLWLATKVLFLLLLLRWLLRRWDPWLKAAVPVIARSVDLGGYALPLAKLTDTVRFAGPSLLVWLVAAVLYYTVGGKKAATEVNVVYVIVFWWAIYRFQLRLVESVARFAGLGAVFDQLDRSEPLEDPNDLEGPPAPEHLPRRPTDNHPPVPRSAAAADGVIPAPELAVRSVRAGTRYILAVLLVLELTSIAVGRGTIYLLTVKFSWWAALPFIYYFLKQWRPHIVSAYQRLTKDRESRRLKNLVARSQHRFYGIFLVGAAFFVVLADRLVRFSRRYLTNLDTTKRLLAFLFRRRVAKHAQQAGRVVEHRQVLPQAIVDQFPVSAIDRAHGAMQPPTLDAIKGIFRTWQELKADGSVAIIGPAGMGKSTLLRLVDTALGVQGVSGQPRTKITRQAKLVSWLGEVFDFSPRPGSESELIRRIREDSRPLVAIDNCHNLFLRRVGGFEAWDAFVRIVNETCDSVFWVMSFNAAAWDYLFNAGGQVSYFRRTVPIAPWTERHIQRLTQLRMARAGFKISFSDLIVANVATGDISAHAGRTSAGYFRMLWDYTGGNPRLAGHFWLDSLVPDETAREVKVHLFAEPKIDELGHLPIDTLFVLTAIAEHENLSAVEAAQTTRLPIDYCRFAINSCLEEGYLVRSEGGRVRLSNRWQRGVLRFLRRRHLVYEAPAGATR